ncbi:unnamed protein product [Bursaphelenchus xylophilus]|nr:unnamed protein product [Bursaphelenchus xylophilus]CAG9097551.1 unnamed protein product [Bursaphelenchus xylophilus]
MILLLVSVTMTSAQMTFSDGWGKRSSPLKPFSAGDDSGVNSNPLLDKCNTEYSQTLVQLHHRIMKLYDTYEQCQTRALNGVATHRQQ